MTTRYLIIGGGLAGAAAIDGIRERDPEGPITLLAAESDLPYDRPPLTKKLWTGAETVEQITLHPAEFYRDQGVDLHLGRRAAALDPRGKLVRDDRSREHGYDRLLLATGGTPRRLEIPGADLPGIAYYRTLADYRRVRALAAPGKTAVVIGGGFIGSEMAAALAVNGVEVTMIFPEDYLVRRVFPAGLGRALNAAYQAKGVRLITGDVPTAIAARGEGFRVQTRGGKTLDADLLVVGVGITPSIELAQQAGLTVGNGVIVNDRLETSDANIFAAGDLAYFPEAVLGPRRIEHWDNAVTQGRHAGRNMAGAREAFTALPFFYSDLFEFGYEAVGEVDSRLEVFADWQEENKTGVLYYLAQGRVRGAMMCNVWDKVEAARALIRAQGPATPERLRGAIQ
jgi:3-phenylpropionate/trans-cinnamate dioxygenase ferredoxin reductase subunit